MAIVYVDQKKYKQALQLNEESLRLATASGNQEHIAYSNVMRIGCNIYEN